jgi:hypothetical protein
MDLHVVPLHTRRPKMGSNDRIYRTFEEFEREELRRLDTMSASVDEMIDSLFGDDAESDGRRRSRWNEEDDE